MLTRPESVFVPVSPWNAVFIYSTLLSISGYKISTFQNIPFIQNIAAVSVEMT